MTSWINLTRQRFAQWLTVGLGIKRWLILLGFGAALVGMGIVYLILLLQRAGWIPLSIYRLLTFQALPVWARIFIPLSLGSFLILLTLRQLGITLVAPFRQPGDRIVDRLSNHRRLQRGPNIVAIGGGTGLSTLLRGLRKHTNNITAIVTVADDGGSSGRIRRELGMLPPGDIRNNMAALARDEALMSQLLQYRFSSTISGEGDSSLHGHSFGNLLLAALAGITGSFDEGLLAAERVLALRGRVMPATLEMVRLVAQIRNPDTNQIVQVEGESAIPKAHGKIEHIALQPTAARAYPPTIRAILQAEMIVIGPGSLYTSIIPNLLLKDLAVAISQAKAKKVYVSNLAIQPGETDNYSVVQHVEVLNQYLSEEAIDIVLVNNNLTVSSDKGGGETKYVAPEVGRSDKMVEADLVDESKPWRHDSHKLARVLMKIINGQVPM